jgi:hypothetical protein
MKGGALAQISVQPQILDLKLYAGDGVEFRLICADGAGAPIDITGSVKAQVRLDRLPASVSIVEFTTSLVDAYQGIIMLSLSGAQTSQLITDPSSRSGVFNGVWDIQWTPANSQPRTLCQGKVECVSDVTR